jgi:glycosyltransferase involved in cell wall biosynthesis
MTRCRALIFPGEEDFGLAPLEAQACGRPVIAFGAGGALETVRGGETGVFFRELTVDALVEGLRSFTDTYDPKVLRAHAMAFDKSVFKERMYELLARRYQEHQVRLEI